MTFQYGSLQDDGTWYHLEPPGIWSYMTALLLNVNVSITSSDSIPSSETHLILIPLSISIPIVRVTRGTVAFGPSQSWLSSGAMGQLANYKTKARISSRGREKKCVFQRRISISPNNYSRKQNHFLSLEIFWILCCIIILKPEEQASPQLVATPWTASWWKLRTQWRLRQKSCLPKELTPHCLTQGESFPTFPDLFPPLQK